MVLRNLVYFVNMHYAEACSESEGDRIKGLMGCTIERLNEVVRGVLVGTHSALSQNSDKRDQNAVAVAACATCGDVEVLPLTISFMSCLFCP